MSSFPFLARSTKYLAFATKASYETSSMNRLVTIVLLGCVTACMSATEPGKPAGATTINRPGPR